MLGAGVLALVAPALAHDLGHTGLLCLFAGFNILAWVAVFFLVPETARVELEELNSICSYPLHYRQSGKLGTGADKNTDEVSALKHIKYRFARLKWSLRLEKEKPRPLYLWAAERTHRD